MLEFINENIIHLSSYFLWITLLLATFIVTIFSLIFIYHWNKFGEGSKTIAGVEIIFLSVMGFLVMTGAIIIKLFENA